jgi:hypothetical protein
VSASKLGILSCGQNKLTSLTLPTNLSTSLTTVICTLNEINLTQANNIIQQLPTVSSGLLNINAQYTIPPTVISLNISSPQKGWTVS